jgi:predicted Fe-Mo cluster-binding NifX family protein
MKVCFPVLNDEGIESRVYNHIGSAFVVVDTETNVLCAIQNRNQHHAKGACNHIQAPAIASLHFLRRREPPLRRTRVML